MVKRSAHAFPCRPRFNACGASAACTTCWTDSARLAEVPHATRHLAAGVDLVAQGEPLTDLVTLLDGWLLLYELLEDGRRQVLHIAVPGDVLVPPPGGPPLPYGIQAATSVTTCTTPARDVIRRSVHDPLLPQRLMAIMTRNAIIAYEHITALGRRTARERVALLLVELYYRCRHVMPAEQALRVPLTQGVLADALGLTAVHVNRTLKTLRADGLLTYDAGVLCILDPDRLAVAACLEPTVARSWLAAPV